VDCAEAMGSAFRYRALWFSLLRIVRMRPGAAAETVLKTASVCAKATVWIDLMGR
jgi:hypothetical protein